MTKLFKTLTLSILATVITACSSYSPLYKKTSETSDKLRIESVAMLDIQKQAGERRVAQIIYQDLKANYRAEDDAKYNLVITIRESKTTLAQERDATEQRSRLTLTATLKFYDINNNKLLLETVFSTGVAYNVEDSPYGTETGKLNARTSAARELSSEAKRRIQLFLLKMDEENKG